MSKTERSAHSHTYNIHYEITAFCLTTSMCVSTDVLQLKHMPKFVIVFKTRNALTHSHIDLMQMMQKWNECVRRQVSRLYARRQNTPKFITTAKCRIIHWKFHPHSPPNRRRRCRHRTKIYSTNCTVRVHTPKSFRHFTIPLYIYLLKINFINKIKNWMLLFRVIKNGRSKRV